MSQESETYGETVLVLQRETSAESWGSPGDRSESVLAGVPGLGVRSGANGAQYGAVYYSP